MPRPPHSRRRQRRRQQMIGALLGAVIAVGAAGAAYAWFTGGNGTSAPAASASVPDTPTVAPVRVDIGAPPPDEPPPSTARPQTTTAPTTTRTAPRTPATAPRSTPSARPAPRGGRPVVWIQAGHADPREPGYRDQTGAGSGPFGSEIGFTTNLAPKVIARLKAAGVDARPTPGQVEPWGAAGAAFVSLHHDSPGGAAATGHAIAGAGENYYHGEGSGTPSPTPYSDSAAHRPATTVSPTVESNSLALAQALDTALRPIHTPANGAHGRYGGVQTREGNPRMMRYYGFYRTTADARVIVEAGAAGSDDAYMANTDRLADAVAAGIITYLKARNQLG